MRCWDLEACNELEIRELLQSKISPPELAGKIMRRLLDTSLSWEEKRPFWHFLFNTGRIPILAEAIQQGLDEKQRVPFDLLIEITARANLEPSKSTLESLFKGLKKQKALEDILTSRGWDKWDKRLTQMRNELSEQKVLELRKHKENMFEKFHFLRSQRMNEQAGRVLRRMLELYPEEPELVRLKAEFDELWAREVLSTHMAGIQAETFERTVTSPSSQDQEMLKSFLLEGEKIVVEQREFAFDLAIAFWFMDEYHRALDILAWAPTSAPADWLHAELLFAARRFLEALEYLNQLEIKYINDPETTFSVSYLRSQCLFELGQKATALEIMQSIVRVRAGYRSAHALILKWTEGVSWE
jgi:tetratricopeptide (TPR) repeat protein